ncbi:MAG: P63C domain-containing protein [Nitrospirae bacterium]|nr:P63C domain-containing protein [Nitrospirota bacterium]
MENEGKAKGGYARAEKLSADQRSEIAKKGASARWNPNEKILKATWGSTDRPLKIGDLEIPCYVLEDGTRVLSGRGMQTALELGQTRGQKLNKLINHPGIKPFISKELSLGISEPIKFTVKNIPRVVFGYEGNVLVDICDAVLQARKENKVPAKYSLVAEQCEILARALAKTGIIALIDEVTGYQAVRPQDALQKYLEMLVRKDLAAWAKKFPDEFYENIYKLKGWVWPGMKKNRFSVVAHYTRDLVYERIAPGLLHELETKSPKDETGNRKNKFHQWLTEDIGDPMLSQHLHSLIMFQRLALSSGYGWHRFVKMVDKVLPKKGTNLEFSFMNETEPNEP